MPGIAYPTKAYQTADAHSADRNHTLVLMFDSSVRFLHRAHHAMQERDYETQCACVTRTQKIISTLMASLDTSVEPQLTGSLWTLYNWLHTNLTEASISDDLQLLEEIIGITTNLRDAWRQAEANCRAGEQTS